MNEIIKQPTMQHNKFDKHYRNIYMYTILQLPPIHNHMH